ncbi:trypsin [Sarocladium strictum]
MELPTLIAALAAILPLAYGAPLEAATTLSPQVLAAMKRDLGLDARDAHARVTFERRAGDVIEQLRTSLGDSFAGAWVEGGNAINVGVTDEASAAKVKDAGAKPVVVKNKLSDLQDAKKALDKIIKEQPKPLSTAGKPGIASYYVDIAANTLVISALSDSVTQAEELAKEVGLSGSEFEVRKVAKMPTTYILGGDSYVINQQAVCSVGFNVGGGFVSAGHCGGQGSPVTYGDGGALGTIEGSVFPGDGDYSFIRTVDGTDLPGVVGTYGNGDQAITGSSVAAVGSGICRSGQTSGYHCGELQGYDVTVNYDVGPVFGLTQTSACAEPGDSGGSFFAGDQAQGMTSGGSGDCTSGGQTFFQPVNEVLEVYGLSLNTA